MNFRELFFNKKVDFLTLREVLKITKCSVVGDVDLDTKVYDIMTLNNAKEGDLSFLTSKKYFHEFLSSKAGFCIISQDMYEKCKDSGKVLLVSDNSHYSYSLILKEFYEEKVNDFDFDGIVHPDSQIGRNVKIANNAFIGKNVKIGNDCVIGPGVVILDGSIIGDNCQINSNVSISFSIIGSGCIIHNGARIGQDGFGFAHNQGANHKVLQIGVVWIGDDVEIGANACIDRGAIRNTKIGNGTKIDNMVQVAHNVEIGKGCFVAGCAAIAGSVKIGDYVQIGGNCGIAGHIEIGDEAQISGMSGVTKFVDPKGVVGGYPARPLREFLRIDVMLSKMIGKKR